MSRSVAHCLVVRLLWTWWWAGTDVHAQAAHEEALDMPILAAAWDAGCVTRDECAALAAAFRDQPRAIWTQQAVAFELPPSRSSRVVDCLRSIPEWQEVFRMAAQSPARRPGSILRLRGDWSGGTSGLLLAYRNKGRTGSDMGCRVTLREGCAEVETGHLKADGLRGTWWYGTLAAGYGQGLVVWTPGPFDDIGGMEGSHRIGRGVRSVSYRQRGVWNGCGWQQKPAFIRPGRPSWCVVGRTWPDQKGTAALGGRLGRFGWAGRVQELLDGDWTGLAGVNGQGAGNGWSLRWAAAAFPEGWEGRVSALKTWSENWEAHFQLERGHPQHPKWRSGELRATTMNPEAMPGFLWKAGISFKRKWDGWVRMEARWWGPPPHRLRRRTAMRIQRRGHRLDIQVIREPGLSFQTNTAGLFGGGHWSASWRKLHSPLALGGPTWRWCVSTSGKGHSVGMALAFMVFWKTPDKGRWRMGVAQAWGAEDAPVRYVQGWDGRPSEPFSQAGFKAFLRWTSGNGAWRLGVRTGWSSDIDPEALEGMSWGIHAFRVEFKPSWPSARQG